MEDEPSNLTARRRSTSIVQSAGNLTLKTNSINSKPAEPSSSFKTVHSNKRTTSEESYSNSDLEMSEIRADGYVNTEDDEYRSEAEDNHLTDDEETGLTQHDRRRRRTRRSQKTRLDERVAGDGSSARRSQRDGAAIGGEEGGEEGGVLDGKLVNATLLRYYIINSLLIGLWYTFSISISVYNKWMFSKENLDFHFPLFTTSFHMLVQFSLSALVLFFIPHLRPSNGVNSADSHGLGSSKSDGGATYQRLLDQDDDDSSSNPKPSSSSATRAAKPHNKQPLMTKWFYFTRISPCGTATALDIGLGNFSLRYISLTFYTMCKSSVLGFVLLFAFIFRLETVSWKLLAIIAVMTGGVITMVAGESAFEYRGFLLVMAASLCSGFRWSLSQILLLRNAATSNPFSSIFFLTPIMFLVLFILAIPIEGFASLSEGLSTLTSEKGTVFGILLLLFPGTLAFLMVAAEFALLKRTSVVTLSVCGIFKEVLTIIAAGIRFGDELSPINVSGLIITIASIAAYNWFKYARMRKDAEKEVANRVSTAIRSEEGARGHHDTEAAGRQGSGDSRAEAGLMRDSISVITRDMDGKGKTPSGNGLVGQSPVKRPEDHE